MSWRRRIRVGGQLMHRVSIKGQATAVTKPVRPASAHSISASSIAPYPTPCAQRCRHTVDSPRPPCTDKATPPHPYRRARQRSPSLRSPSAAASCLRVRASGPRPTPASPATLEAARGPYRRPVRRHQVLELLPPAVNVGPGHRECLVRGGRLAVCDPDALDVLVNRQVDHLARMPRPIVPASAVPTVHRGPRARSRARRWCPPAAPAGPP